MEITVTALTLVATMVGILFLFNWLMGYRKDYLFFDFDERFFDQNNYINAIQEKLKAQGKKVHYEGNGRFLIDGRQFLFYERNVSMSGVPLQRTILKPSK
ncbi:hypothetical protein [Bacillus sp. 2205SS5-2]|uniref:hypothetical protein n=1 Tax=Bacillus sp. 2205SS5-2 TaxID=3109031 RepID=UPI0030066029